MHKPTDQQQAIIDAAKAGQSIICSAGAGCSKTSTIEMFAPEIQNATMLAFNVSIKKELEQRIPERHQVLTMNGLGHRAWQKVVRPRLTVSADKCGDILKPLLEEMSLEKEEWAELFPDILKLVSLAKHSGIVPTGQPYKGLLEDDIYSWESLADAHWIEFSETKLTLARQVLRESIKQAYNGSIDFDDQIYMSVLFGAPYEQRKVLTVDEAQDLSPINHKQLKKCRPEQLIVVGDPRQAIYGFRGADSKSMQNILIEFKHMEFQHLPLSTTFRCPKSVVARQLTHYPEYNAFHTNPEGEVRHWQEWGIRNFPNDTLAILCRNNAPIISLAFKLLRERIPVQVLGRDIAKNLKNLFRKAVSDDIVGTEKLLANIEHWRSKELERAGGKTNKIESIHERADSLVAIAANAKTLNECLDLVDRIFSNDNARIILATGHRAKGLEWNNVIHLDPWRIPSKFAKEAAESGNSAPMQQENNLRYVIETRTRKTLTMASLENFTE